MPLCYCAVQVVHGFASVLRHILDGLSSGLWTQATAANGTDHQQRRCRPRYRLEARRDMSAAQRDLAHRAPTTAMATKEALSFSARHHSARPLCCPISYCANWRMVELIKIGLGHLRHEWRYPNKCGPHMWKWTIHCNESFRSRLRKGCSPSSCFVMLAATWLGRFSASTPPSMLSS